MPTRPSAYDKNLGQLRMLGPIDGDWVDAGCGAGAFTLPLATLVSGVKAIDIQAETLERLRARVPDNVTCIQGDIYKDALTQDATAGGVLFAFSLHYRANRMTAIQNARRALVPGGQIVLFDYDFRAPRPWVPVPLSLKRAESLLKEAGFTPEVIYTNSRFYILRGWLPTGRLA